MGVSNEDNNNRIEIVKEFLKEIKVISKNMPILKMVYSRIATMDNLSKKILRSDGTGFYDKVIDLWNIKDSIYRLASFDISLKKALIKIDDAFIRSVKSVDMDIIKETHSNLLENRQALSKIQSDNDFTRKLSMIREEHLHKIIEVSKLLSYRTLRLLNEMPSRDTISNLLNMISIIKSRGEEQDKQYHNITLLQNKLEKELEILRIERKRIYEASNFIKRIEKAEIRLDVGADNEISYDKKNNIINVIINKSSLPKGEKGDDGVGIKFDIVGLAKDLYLYNSQPRGFSYLAYDVPCIYVKTNEKPNNWSRPIKLDFLEED